MQFAGSHFLKKKGIPQGSIISSFLCNYFYAAMEKEHLPYYGKDEVSMPTPKAHDGAESLCGHSFKENHGVNTENNTLRKCCKSI